MRILKNNFGNFKKNGAKTLIFGNGSLADSIFFLLMGNKQCGLMVEGIFNLPKDTKQIFNQSFRDEFMSIIINKKISKVILSLNDRRGMLPIRELLECKLKGIEIVDAHSLYEEVTGKLFLEEMKPSWLLFSDGFKSNRYFVKRLKRMSDLFFAISFLLIFFLPMIIIGIIMKLNFRKGTIFYKQIRVGKDGKLFEMLKFRSMVMEAEKNGPIWASDNDERVTKIGKLLRRTRFDELPQLINIIKGDMSFIGPRPERPYFVEKFVQEIPFYNMRQSVRPGISGWAQVKLGYTATLEETREKLKYDLYYIKNMNLLLDIRILIHSIRIVIFGKGAK